MLDDSSAAKKELHKIKVELSDFIHYEGDDITEEFVRRFGERPPEFIVGVLK